MAKVLKFGGTSVGTADNIRRVAKIVTNENARITVLSAMSGTTDALVKISSAAAQNGHCSEVESLLEMLADKYRTCIKELLEEPDEALDRLEATLQLITQHTRQWRGYESERIVIAQGELLTSFIFVQHLNQSGMAARLLTAPDMVRKDSDEKVDALWLENKIKELTVDTDIFYVTQGFICTDSIGRIDNLGRGGSDYSAALMGAAIGASQVQIWTDIDGMHNNDPRYVENTYPIRRMSFDEAAELAYFGAKILHPATIVPCKEKGIPVLLKNTMDPSAEGTKISDCEECDKKFHAVAAKDKIIVIRIYSTRMLMAYGFLRKVFGVFEKYRTPIDMITTSEVAVSLTIDSDCHLDEITGELTRYGTIEIERDNTIVCVVGNIQHDSCGMAAEVFGGVRDIPVKMISYGASHRSIAMLIETSHKKQFLQKLNDTLFAADAQ